MKLTLCVLAADHRAVLRRAGRIGHRVQLDDRPPLIVDLIECGHHALEVDGAATELHELVWPWRRAVDRWARADDILQMDHTDAVAILRHRLDRVTAALLE